jgi:hypothetical protein
MTDKLSRALTRGWKATEQVSDYSQSASCLSLPADLQIAV